MSFTAPRAQDIYVPVMRRIFLLAGLMLFATHAAAHASGFATWLHGMRREAMAAGVAASTFDRSLAGVRPISRVIELDERQPELTLTFAQYIARVVTPSRRAAADAHYRAHRALLDDIGKRYGVAPQYIVALWGIETDFGRKTGSYPVIAALATLAYESRRAAFFRRELISALLIVQKDHVDPRAMIGSWAGAMGQSQFMPSSFLKFAVSYNGKGPPDIWHRLTDVFASIANYLARNGWRTGRPWGWRVAAPARIDSSLVGIADKRPLADWAAMGIKRADGGALLDGHADPRIRAALLQPGGSAGPSFLVTHNFNVILRWNNSSYFAIAVGEIADSVH